MSPVVTVRQLGLACIVCDTLHSVQLHRDPASDGPEWVEPLTDAVFSFNKADENPENGTVALLVCCRECVPLLPSEDGES